MTILLVMCDFDLKASLSTNISQIDPFEVGSSLCVKR